MALPVWQAAWRSGRFRHSGHGRPPLPCGRVWRGTVAILAQGQRHAQAEVTGNIRRVREHSVDLPRHVAFRQAVNPAIVASVGSPQGKPGPAARGEPERRRSHSAGRVRSALGDVGGEIGGRFLPRRVVAHPGERGGRRETVPCVGEKPSGRFVSGPERLPLPDLGQVLHTRRLTAASSRGRDTQVGRQTAFEQVTSSNSPQAWSIAAGSAPANSISLSMATVCAGRPLSSRVSGCLSITARSRSCA
jgi:hypothetical protein